QWLVNYLVQRALRGLPATHRDRFDEEWRSHINEIPGAVGKVITAFGLLRASRRMSQQLGELGEHARSPGKRLFDLCLTTPFAVFMAPLLIVAYCIFALEDVEGPRLYLGQQRRTFFLYDFKRRHAIQDDIALRSQSAIERLCYLMRRLYVDRLLFFWPVILGHMSVIGPNPVTPAQAQLLSKKFPEYYARFAVKPGFLSPAVLADISRVDDPIERARLELECDLDYVRHRSMARDLRILRSALVMAIRVFVETAKFSDGEP